jgi:DNA polymerase III alpha subunit
MRGGQGGSGECPDGALRRRRRDRPRATAERGRGVGSAERLAYEFSVLGVYLSAHPMDGYAEALATISASSRRRRSSNRPRRYNGKMVELAGVVVAQKEKKTERSRFAVHPALRPSAQYEVMLFSDVLERSRELLVIGTAVVLHRRRPHRRRRGQALGAAAAAARRGRRPARQPGRHRARRAGGRHPPEAASGRGRQRCRCPPRHPHADGREVVVALPEAISLAHAKRPASSASRA